MKKLYIKETLQLNSLNDLIHDEYLNLDDLKYDREKDIVDLPFWRIFHYYNPPRIIKRGLLSKIGEVDVLRCNLQIKNVQKYDVFDNSRIGTYSFNGVQYDPNSKVLKFITNEDCNIDIAINNIQIEYVELEYRGKARIRYWIFGESTDSKIYD